MEKNKILTNLISFGLSEPEAKVYIAVLEMETAPVEKISRRSGTNRTSTYPILDRLEAAGLVGQVRKKGKTVYQAAAPNKFLDILEEKKAKVNEVMPDLKGLFAIQEGRPSVEMFVGAEGLKTVLNTILSEAKTEILIFSDGESFLKKLPGWSDTYIAKRSRKDLNSRIIVKESPYNAKARKAIRSGEALQAKTTKLRMLPEGYRIDYGGFDIYNHKVVLYSFDRQNVAVVIESKMIANLMRTVFEILWNEAGRYENRA